MINYIIGEKGFGKTKAMIDLANTEVEKAKGDIVFLTDKNKNIHAVSNKVRLIPIEESGMSVATLTEDMMLGFIYGVLSANYDIQTMYIDGAHRLLNKQVSDMEYFFTNLAKIADNTKVDFCVSVSTNVENTPKFIKKKK